MIDIVKQVAFWNFHGSIRPDGTVKIPEGNLFDDVDHGARSEVYVMGNRNPFRISVDPKTGRFWGRLKYGKDCDSP